MRVSSVAAPVRIGQICASFSVRAVGPVRRLTPAYRKEIGEQVIEVAGKINAAIQLCNMAQIEKADIPLL